jgi:protein-L-isoaspartate(D-aspartate) O-methyltransferase
MIRRVLPGRGPGGIRSAEAAREAMVERQLAGRGIRDGRILAAFRDVPREAFVPDERAEDALGDHPLPIGCGQTISQPYIVALMLEAAELRPADRALEVGAGSGYAAALLGRLAREVVAVERHAELARAAAERLARLGIGNVAVHAGDGSLGWPAAAPFDAILVSAGGPRVPEPLKAQLAPGGRLVMPVGPLGAQRLVRLVRKHGGFAEEDLGGVSFVPLVGAEAWAAAAR